MHLKNLIKISGFFCSHFNIEDGRKYATFLAYYALYFKKSKNATKTQKKICAVYGESAVTDQMCQKWSVKSCAGDSLLYDVPWLGRPAEVDSDQIRTIKNNQHHTTREIADISKYPNQ